MSVRNLGLLADPQFISSTHILQWAICINLQRFYGLVVSIYRDFMGFVVDN